MIGRLEHAIAILRRDEGAGTLELALSTLVLFAMLFGICQMSIALYAYHYVADAARQGSRYAMVRGNTSCANTKNLSNCGATDTQISTWVKSLHYPGIRTSNSKFTVTTAWCQASQSNPSSSNPQSWAACSSSTPSSPGNLVQVTVTYPLAFTVPFSKNLSLNLSSTSEMVISQ